MHVNLINEQNIDVFAVLIDVLSYGVAAPHIISTGHHWAVRNDSIDIKVLCVGKSVFVVVVVVIVFIILSS